MNGQYKKIGYEYEHRLIAEHKLGRPLRRGEEVHHINGDKRDNRPENLQVVASSSEHQRLHDERGPELEDEIERMLRAGITSTHIAEQLRTSSHRIVRVRHQRGLGIVAKQGKKRTFDRARAAALRAEGRTLGEVARALGVTVSAIASALWKHDPLAEVNARIAEVDRSLAALREQRRALIERKP